MRSVAIWSLLAAACLMASGAVPAQEVKDKSKSQAPKSDLQRELLLEQTKHYSARISWAHRELHHNSVPQSLDILKECREELRGWEYAYVRNLCDQRLRIFNDSGWQVRCVAFSADGKRIASAYENDINIWDAETCQLITTLKGHKDRVARMAFSSDGKTLASSTAYLPAVGHEVPAPAEIKVWDVAAGAAKLTIKGDEFDFVPIAFSPDCRWAAARSEAAGAVVVYNLKTGEKLFPLSAQTRDCDCMAYSADGRRLACGKSYEKASEIQIWEASSGRLALKIDVPGLTVLGVAYSQDCRKMAAFFRGGTVKIWDLSTSGKAQTVDIKTDSVATFAFDPDCKRLVTSSRLDPTVKVWDLATGKATHEFKGQARWVCDAAFSPDGQYLGTGDVGVGLSVWNLAPRPVFSLIKAVSEEEIEAFAFSPNGQVMATACNPVSDGPVPPAKKGGLQSTVRLLNAKTGKEIASGKGHTDVIRCIAFAPDGKYVATGSKDSTVRIWNAATGKEQFCYKGHGKSVFAVAIDPNGRIASGGEDGLKIWNAASGKQAQVVNAKTGFVRSLSFSADGKKLAAIDEDGVRLWDVATWKETEMANPAKVLMRYSVALSPDGKWLAVAGMLGQIPHSNYQPGFIQVWDAVTGASVYVFDKDIPACDSLAISPDSRRLAGTDSNGNTLIWDLATGIEVARLGDNRKWWSDGLAFSPDGSTLARGQGDAVKIWDAGNFGKKPTK